VAWRHSLGGLWRRVWREEQNVLCLISSMPLLSLFCSTNSVPRGLYGAWHCSLMQPLFSIVPYRFVSTFPEHLCSTATISSNLSFYLLSYRIWLTTRFWLFCCTDYRLLWRTCERNCCRDFCALFTFTSFMTRLYMLLLLFNICTFIGTRLPRNSALLVPCC